MDRASALALADAGYMGYMSTADYVRGSWGASLYRECFQHLYEIERRRIPPTPTDHLRLHRLERPETWEAELLDKIWAAQNPINFYADYSVFYERLSAFINRPKEQIVVGAGIEGIIKDLFMLCCGPGDTVAFTYPTCAMFDVYAQVFGARAAHIPADPRLPFLAYDLLNCLPRSTKLLILPNPGQPVEKLFELGEMREIAGHCHEYGTLLAIDEAYYGFGAPTCLPLVDEFDNVVVLRTFSKAFGAAGIRVGYAVGGPKVIKPLEAVRASGEIAGPSLTAATVLMDHWGSHIEPGIRAVCAGRDWLRERLNAEGHHASGWFANHVLVDMGSAEKASYAAARLLERGVHVRTNAPPVDRHLLVTCGSIGLMQRFYEAFREIV